jgi:hypothetical protein
LSSIIYTVTCATFVPIVYFFYPEVYLGSRSHALNILLIDSQTAGRSLEEIDVVFVESKSIFDAVQVAKRLPRMHLSESVVEEKVGKAEHTEVAHA